MVFGLRLLSRTWYRIVGAIGDPDVALAIDLKPVRQVELTGSLAGFSLPACARNRPFLSYFTTRLLQ